MFQLLVTNFFRNKTNIIKKPKFIFAKLALTFPNSTGRTPYQKWLLSFLKRNSRSWVIKEPNTVFGSSITVLVQKLLCSSTLAHALALLNLVRENERRPLSLGLDDTGAAIRRLSGPAWLPTLKGGPIP